MTPSSLPESFQKKVRIPFMRQRWSFASVSIFFIAISFYSFFTKGFNFGVDFKGGVKLVYQFKQETNEGDLRKLLTESGVESQIVRYGKENENTFLFKIKEDEKENYSAKLSAVLQKNFDNPTLLSEDNIKARAGKDLRQRGIFAIILTCVCILFYVGWRFDFLFAPGAILALAHDVIISLGAFSFFQKEVDLSILAAILTIIGYSVNDTIVIYDRIRENIKKLPSSLRMTDLIDISMNEMLGRTIVTSLTVLFSVTVLYLFGGKVIHDFAFCMIVGVIAGVYSTVFIASPIYIALQKFFPDKGLQRTTKK